MKRTVHLLLIWVCACAPQWVSAHDYHEFSHSVPPNVQGQILDVLDNVLNQLPPPTEAKNADPKNVAPQLTDRLLERVDMGSAATNRLLVQAFGASPLSKTFAPIGLPVFIEELSSMTDEYQEHAKSGLATFLTPATISRIKSIEKGLERAKK